MISVCIAMYNGAEYIVPQLLSIINQISDQDEIIIVDDCSKDISVSIVESISDSRIKVFKNESNLGVIKTFEKAIGLSSGDFIFLSDQDDIWMPNKVKVMLKHLKDDGSDLVLSDAYILNGENLELDTFFQYRRSSIGFMGNMVKNSFIGCCMAFKESAKKFILPFPASISMHDSWIGLIMTLNGRVKMIPDRLIIYRRHDANVTSMSRSSILRMINNRFMNAISLLSRMGRLKVYDKS